MTDAYHDHLTYLVAYAKRRLGGVLPDRRRRHRIGATDADP